jgi:antirestriction protein ArdC
MSNKVYDIITQRIIDQLEAGVIPWRKPWGVSGNGEMPKNGITGRHYSGINLLMLNWGEEYFTFKQVQEKHWTIKKGSKASIVIFFSMLEKPNKKNSEEVDQIPLMRYYNVFAGSDIEGYKEGEKYEHDTIEEAEDIARRYAEVPIHHHNNNRAFYSPMEDYINVPDISCFPIKEEYYSTLFHEMTHSTGHTSRLNRFVGVAANASFGSKAYSFEELIAELGASFLCGSCGIEQKTLDNSASYISSWLKVLKEDNKTIVRAAAKAQRAVDYIKEGQHEKKVKSCNMPKDQKPVSKSRPHFNKAGEWIGK